MSYKTSPWAYFVAGAASFGTLSLLYSYFNLDQPNVKAFPSPLDTRIPHLSQTARQSLPYPPDNLLQGTRDVSTPYGSIRVYEFGPADSTRKIVFMHGISTPCVALADIAKDLAARGCRVLLFDLFGRGYSEGPKDLPYDSRLYASQLLLALTSSEVAWIGSGNRFTLVGYSLGGGLAADFTSWFPDLVEDLVLIAPGGLLRTIHINWKSKIVYSGMLPQWLLRWLVSNRLRSDPNIQTKVAEGEKLADTVDAEAVVDWQLDHHPGFTHAFVNSIRFAPIHKQHTRWALMAARLDFQREIELDDKSRSSARRRGLRSGKILLFLGETDSVVRADEVATDATGVLGDENLEVNIVKDAGHELPITKAKEMANSMWTFWERQGGTL